MCTLMPGTTREMAFAVTPQNTVYSIWGYHKYILLVVVVDRREMEDVSVVVGPVEALVEVHIIGMALMRTRWATKLLVNTADLAPMVWEV